MKFDMGRAWNDATKMIIANKEVLGIVAGVFFFLPSMVLSILAPGTELEAAAGDPDKMQAALALYAGKFGWLFFAYVVVTMVGSLALYALVGKHTKPTVGEAIKIGFIALLPYVASSLIVGLGLSLLFIVVVVLASVTGSTALGAILGIGIAILFFFISIRLVLVGAIMAIEDIYNPIAAMTRSWHLVKGNTRYILAFLILIVVTMLIVGSVLGLIFGLAGALLGAGAALWIEAALGGLLSAAMSILMLAIYASIHKQLTGGVDQSDLETFG